MTVTTPLPEKTQMSVYEGQNLVAQARVARPNKFFLTRLKRSGYSLRIPLELIFEQEEGYITISDQIFELYGQGKELQDALLDYEDSLIEFLEDLEKNADHLAEHLSKHLDNLRKYLART